MTIKTTSGPRGVMLSHSTKRNSFNVVLCQHKSRGWYLCDRSYVAGKQRHLILEAYGKERPVLYPPAIESGLAEEKLPKFPAGTFDLVYLDPPYGTTAGEWDNAPDWEWLGEEAARILKPTGQVVLHGSGAMAARALVAFEKNLSHRFELVWVKEREDGRLRTTAWVSDYEPLRAHELIHVFKRKDATSGSLTFNRGAMHRHVNGGYGSRGSSPTHQGKGWNGNFKESTSGYRWPVDVIFKAPNEKSELYAAKPEDLTRLLLTTLTNPGDFVLDTYAGIGTTLLMAFRLGRRAYGIEASPKSFRMIKESLESLVGDKPSHDSL